MRNTQTLLQLQTILGPLLQMDPTHIRDDVPFLEMGADSLILIDAVRTIEQTFGIKLPIRQLFEELTTLGAVAAYIDRLHPPERAGDNGVAALSSPQGSQSLPSFVPTHQPEYQTTWNVAAPSETEIEAVITQQLEVMARQQEMFSQIMSQQLEVLSGSRRVSQQEERHKEAETMTASTTTMNTATPSFVQSTQEGKRDTTSSVTCMVRAQTQRGPDVVSTQQIHEPEVKDLRQKSHLETLMRRYTEKTAKSKRQTQAYRHVLADSRASVGFRFSTKEMLYPIIADKSLGSHIWDLDGNRYVDISMGFGVHLFGHNPTIVKDALIEQIGKGIQLGPQAHLAGEVAELIHELTGMERVAFCNSGTEAVMTALRIARTATRKTKVALFNGSFHGSFDGILARSQFQDHSAPEPVAPGIPQHIVDDILVLDYNKPESLSIIQAHAHELAAVLVEPVQSRFPALQPRTFLHQLRKLTSEIGVALIFDETITGFRIHPGGAQAWFEVEADLTVYGKIVGGGMPIGIIAGKSGYLDAIDGGMWQYGDASYPQAETTFFAGTFSKHPLAMASARAVLQYMKSQGPDLQTQLNRKTERMAEVLNAFFKEENAPLHCVYFGSLFRFSFRENMDLFFYHLLEKGIYVWEGRNCFLSTAHTDEDIATLIEHVKDTIHEMRAGGFLPEGPPHSPFVREGLVHQDEDRTPSSPFPPEMLAFRRQNAPSETETRSFPLTAAQQDLWVAAQLDKQGGFNAYVETVVLRLDGELLLPAMQNALQEVVNRHEALRTVISSQGDQQQIKPEIKIDVSFQDISSFTPTEREQSASRWLDEAGYAGLDLTHGPLIGLSILRLAAQRHLLLLAAHHSIADGWSLALILQELAQLYSAQVQQQSCKLPPALQFREYISWQEQQAQQEAFLAAERFWEKKLAEPFPPLSLPFDHPRLPYKTFNGARVNVTLEADLLQALRKLATQQNCTLYMVLLAAYLLWLHRMSGQNDIVVGIPMAGRTCAGSENLVGHVMNFFPLCSVLVDDPTFLEYLHSIKQQLLELYEHQDYPIASIEKKGDPQGPSSPINTTFNLDPPVSLDSLCGLAVEFLPSPVHYVKFDLSVFVTVIADGLNIDVHYNEDLFEAETARRLVHYLLTLIENISQHPDLSVWQQSLLTSAEVTQLLVEWNATKTDYPQDLCLHQFFEQQVGQTPDFVALALGEDQALTYTELNQQANQLARHLQRLGIGPDHLVGICMERSIEMVIGILAVLKAGGAYVPLDPAYPQERLAWILADSQVTIVLTHHLLDGHHLPVVDGIGKVINLDTDWKGICGASHDPYDAPCENPLTAVASANLAYVIYTSGSTGKPKGTMVTHHHVTNFFTAMDLRIGNHGPGIWLAVTSISFDISVLELLWTLTRGFRVVVQSDQKVSSHPQSHSPHQAISTGERWSKRTKELEFSLFYFANDTVGTSPAATGKRYKLLLEGAKFADAHNFTAVWTPERHFHSFGGLYPNPSVTSAAIATVTSRVQIRAGSVVLPLHDPVRVAEEWAVVDNLSGGRVGISFASGWHANDFVLAPEQYTDRKKILLDRLETVRKLWRGESIALDGPTRNAVQVKIYPQPIQPELPIWMTSSGNPETFRQAGEMGMNLLTHLLGQNIESLAEKIAIYRDAWQMHGHTGSGHVTLMLHTFIGTESAAVREKVREPLSAYLRSSVELFQTLAESLGYGKEAKNLSEDDIDVILAHGFDRYYETSGLMGTVSTCLPMVERLKEIGVDEVACLIDFGVDEDAVLSSLHELAKLKQLSNKKKTVETLPASIKRQGITHLQCTPSLARLFLLEPESESALGSLQKLLLGGEALPATLAKQLGELVGGEIHNMYGPTETTIWSTTQRIEKSANAVSIGRPIANTQVYILDKHLQLLPIGVPGELFIGGKGVVRGYLNQPALTAEKFLPNPYAKEEKGALIYRTGDVARYLLDGTIEYLGRSDTQQVKLRGFRIELGEIEATLQAHPAVQEVVVILCEDSSPTGARKYLVAYIVRQAGASPTSSALQEYLRERLPDYMVPTSMSFLARLPLMPNGKVDRKALGQAQGTVPTAWEQQELAFVAPRNPVEQCLSTVWREVLGLDQVDVHDNFFALGGDSILSIHLVARARQKGLQITPKQVFQHQTIAQLATVVTPLSPQSIETEEGDGLDEGRSAAQGTGSEPRTTPTALPPLAHLTQAELNHLKAKHPQMEDLYPLTPLQQCKNLCL